MSEILKAEGKLEEVSETSAGTKKDRTEWTRYKYKVNGRYYSGFIDVKKLDPPQKIGDTVILAYTESPNPSGTHPYKNVKAITPTVSNEELKESNEEYNVKDVGVPLKEFNYNDGAFFGMCSNQAMAFIMQKQKLNSPGEKDWNYQDKFSKIFDIIWEENLKKRKEKLEWANQ